MKLLRQIQRSDAKQGVLTESKTTDNAFFVNAKEFSDPFAFARFGTQIHSLQLRTKQLSLPQPLDAFPFVHPRRVWANRRQACQEVDVADVPNLETKALYRYHNDHDFSWRSDTYLDFAPTTPCAPYPDMTDVQALQFAQIVIVQTSFGFWVVKRTRGAIDSAGYEQTQDQLHRLLYLNNFNASHTHGPRNQQELHRLHTLLKVENLTHLNRLGISLTYHARSKISKIIWL
jgi:hypothetical protein